MHGYYYVTVPVARYIDDFSSKSKFDGNIVLLSFKF